MASIIDANPSSLRDEEDTSPTGLLGQAASRRILLTAHELDLAKDFAPQDYSRMELLRMML
jgi:hypothetical protein